MYVYDKHFAVYEAMRGFIGSSVGSGNVEEDTLAKLYLAAGEAKWLFSESVERYISD